MINPTSQIQTLRQTGLGGLKSKVAAMSSPLMPSSQTIVLIGTDPSRADWMADALRAGGDYDITTLRDLGGLARKIAALQPDAVLIDLADPTPDLLLNVALACGADQRPVAIFVEKSGPGLAKATVIAGVSAYVVDGLHPSRIQPVLETAMARFDVFSRMRTELETTKAALADRKLIERAKGLLMSARGLSEDEAYRELRRAAMDQGRKLTEVAAALIAAADLLR